MKAYLDQVKRQLHQQQAMHATKLETIKLSSRIKAWHDAFPVEKCDRSFHIDEIMAGIRHPDVKDNPSTVGLTLVELGWRRTRTWSGTGNYRRAWMPPTNKFIDK